MSSIKVNPSGLPNAVNVSVDTVDDLVYPEYKIVYSLEGEAPVHASSTNPFPVTALSSSGSEVGVVGNSFIVDSPGGSNTKELLEEILQELKFNTLFVREMTGFNFTYEDIEQD